MVLASTCEARSSGRDGIGSSNGGGIAVRSDNPNRRREPARREFHLGDVLSVTTGRLVSLRHISGVYDVLGYMTGEALFTHQLPRAEDECREPLLAQHPQLRDVRVPDTIDSLDACRDWLETLYPIYGEHLSVEALAEHEPRDPIEELCDKVGAEKVWVIPLPEAGDG